MKQQVQTRCSEAPLQPQAPARPPARPPPSPPHAPCPPPLHFVGPPVDDVAKGVARAVDLLAGELCHQDGLLLQELKVHQLHLAGVQQRGVGHQALHRRRGWVGGGGGVRGAGQHAQQLGRGGTGELQGGQHQTGRSFLACLPGRSHSTGTSCPPTHPPARPPPTPHLLLLRAHDAGEALNHLGGAVVADGVLVRGQVGLQRWAGGQGGRWAGGALQDQVSAQCNATVP